MEKELKKTTSRFDKFILGVGLIVGILGTFITFISNIEIYQLLRIFSIIIYLIYWYRDKNYKLKYLFMRVWNYFCKIYTFYDKSYLIENFLNLLVN